MLLSLLVPALAVGTASVSVAEISAELARLEARVDAQERELAALRGGVHAFPRSSEDGDDTCQIAPFAWPCPPSIESRVAAAPFAQFERVMMVTAHPDDESLGSGTLARFAQLGKEVTIVCLTNGDKGTSDPNVTSAALAKTRAAELQRAAAALGATAVMLSYEDGGLQNTYEARLRVAAQIRIRRPQLLLTFNPTYNFNHFQHGSEHKDHKASGAIALDAFYPTARDHLQFKELWQPLKYAAALAVCCPELRNLTSPLAGWKVEETYLFATERLGRVGGTDVPLGATSSASSVPRYQTVEIALTEEALEAKAQSLSMHVSQTGGKSWQEVSTAPAPTNTTASHCCRCSTAHMIDSPSSATAAAHDPQPQRHPRCSFQTPPPVRRVVHACCQPPITI